MRSYHNFPVTVQSPFCCLCLKYGLRLYKVVSIWLERKFWSSGYLEVSPWCSSQQRFQCWFGISILKRIHRYPSNPLIIFSIWRFVFQWVGFYHSWLLLVGQISFSCAWVSAWDPPSCCQAQQSLQSCQEYFGQRFMSQWRACNIPRKPHVPINSTLRFYLTLCICVVHSGFLQNQSPVPRWKWGFSLAKRQHNPAREYIWNALYNQRNQTWERWTNLPYYQNGRCRIRCHRRGLWPFWSGSTLHEPAL